MITRCPLSICLISVVATTLPACQRQYRLFQTGTITSRAPIVIAQDSVPAMFVVDDTSFSSRPCTNATRFFLTRDTRVLHHDGTLADTAGLVLGRRVSVFIRENESIFESCPPVTTAAKVILH